MAAANRSGGLVVGASCVQATDSAGGGMVAATSRAGKKAPRTPTIPRAATGPKPERTNARIIDMPVIPRRCDSSVPRCWAARPVSSHPRAGTGHRLAPSRRSTSSVLLWLRLLLLVRRQLVRESEQLRQLDPRLGRVVAPRL